MKYIPQEERLDGRQFAVKILSYPSYEDAIKDGVGVEHSFPPLGDVETLWNKLVAVVLSSE